MKHLYSPQTLEAFKMINLGLSGIATQFYNSPAFEIARQIEANNKLLTNQFRTIATALESELMGPISSMQKLANSFAPFVDELSKMHSSFAILDQSLRQQLFPLQEHIKNLHLVSEHALGGIAQAFRAIPRELLLQVKLNAKFWLIIDADLLEKILHENISDDSKLVAFIRNYYTADSWHNVDKMLDNWKSEIDEERIVVFKTALEVTRSTKVETVHQLTIPSLIAQLDGLVREMRSALPGSVKKRIEKEIRDRLAPEEKEKRIDLRKEVSVQTVAEIVDFWSAELLQEVIFSGLFRDSKNITPDESYALFRHQVVHGDKDSLKHQHEENFIRLILYSDFVINLTRQIKSGSLKIETEVTGDIE